MHGTSFLLLFIVKLNESIFTSDGETELHNKFITKKHFSLKYSVIIHYIIFYKITHAVILPDTWFSLSSGSEVVFLPDTYTFS